jgi:hypothetical protein
VARCQWHRIRDPFSRSVGEVHVSQPDRHLCAPSRALRFVLALRSIPLSPFLAISIGMAAGGTQADVPADWWTSVGQEISDAEYEVTWQTRTSLPDLEASWQAPNRAHDFRTFFAADGIRVIPRGAGRGDGEPDGAAAPWEWSLKLARWGRAGSTEQVLAPARLSVDGNRIDYDRGTLVESYVNDKRGLKHAFKIEGAPASKGGVAETGGLVHLDLALGGTLAPVVATDGQAIDFVTAGGARVLRYAELHVEDARGRVLRSWMEGISEPGLRGIRIVYDGADAVYPVTVDPLATSPAWTAESNLAGASFGYSVAMAGDVNGDGYSDVIVGAPLFDNLQLDEGRAYVYHGSASGLSTSPAWTAESDQPLAQFGSSVGTAGDVNGDGYTDVIVAAYQYDNGESDEGRVFVYHGSAAGLSPSPAWMSESDQAGANLGSSVATAGDVNGDGYSDVIIGAYRYDNGQSDEGSAYAYLGSAAGLATSPAWTTEGDQASAQFGFSVATAGDLNGDGYADVIVGARWYDNGQADEGRAFVYHGSAAGLSSSPLWTAESDQAFSEFGTSASTAGDVDGDGYADVIIGAPRFDNGQTDEGRAYAYRGSPRGSSRHPPGPSRAARRAPSSGTSSRRRGTSTATATPTCS